MATNTPSQVLLYRIEGHKNSIVHRFQLIDLNPKTEPIDHLLNEEVHVITLPDKPAAGVRRWAEITTVSQHLRGKKRKDTQHVGTSSKWTKNDIPAVFGKDVILYQVVHNGVVVVSHPICDHPESCPCKDLEFPDELGSGASSKGHPQWYFEFNNEEKSFLIEGFSFYKGRILYGDDEEKKCGWTGWKLALKDGQNEADFDTSKFDLGIRGADGGQALVERAYELSKAIPA